MVIEKILKIFIVQLLIFSSITVAQTMEREGEIENIVNQIATLMQQISRLQSSLEYMAPERFKCRSNLDCVWCGFFCVHKDIGRNCFYAQPRPGFECVCENERCVTKPTREECKRGKPEININPIARIVSAGEEAIYQGIIRSRDLFCNSSSFNIEIICPQNFICSVMPTEIEITRLSSYPAIRISVKSPKESIEGVYNFTVKVINKYNTSLFDEARGEYIIKKFEREDFPRGTLKVDKKIAKIGENITLTIEAEDDNGIESVMAFFLGKWNTKNCNKEKTCIANFIFTEESAGTRYYYGYVRGYTADGKRTEGTFTKPAFVEVKVVEEIPVNECIRGVPNVAIEPKMRVGKIGDVLEYIILVKSTDRNCKESSFKLEAECPQVLKCRIEPSSIKPLIGIERSKLVVNTSEVKEIGSYKIKVKAINEFDTSLVGEAEATAEIIREEAPPIEDRATGVLTASKHRVRVGEIVNITLSARDNNGLHSISIYTSERRWETHECNKTTKCEKTWAFNLTTSGTKTFYGIIRGYKTDGSIEITYPTPPVVNIIVEEIWVPAEEEVPDRLRECNKNEDCMWCGAVCMKRQKDIACHKVLILDYICVCENGRCVAKKIEEEIRCSKNEDCTWCGIKCMAKQKDMICPKIAPPVGYSCVCENERCTAKRV